MAASFLKTSGIFLMAGALAAVPVDAAQRKAKAPPRTDAGIIAASGLPANAIGYIVYDLKARRVLVARYADRLFAPASVAKVPTTVAALGMLGADYRFETRIYARTNGAARRGALGGDLYLVGGGDPLLTADHMAAMIRSVASMGFSRINGRFFYDESFLRPIPAIAQMQPDYAPHNTGVGALSVNFNRVRMQWVRAGKQAVLQTSTISKTDKRKVAIGTIGFALGQPGGRWRGPFTYAALGGRDHWILSPYLRRKGRVWLPVRKAGITAAEVFRQVGLENGLELPAPKPGKLPADVKLLHSYRSLPLTEVSRRVLYYSNNLAAELTGLVATRNGAGKTFPLDQSGAAMTAWFKKRMPKADWNGFTLANHSGLSLESRMSPRQVLAVLRYAWPQRYGRYSYEAMLKPYYLRRNARPRGRFSVRAKSGTMNYIRGRAGYIRSVQGRRLAFVLFVNQIEARRDVRRKTGAKRTMTRYGPRGWMHRARLLEHNLIARWVRSY